MKNQVSEREVDVISCYLGISFAVFALLGLIISALLLSISNDPKNTFILGLSKSRLLLFLINMIIIGLLTYLSIRFLRREATTKKWFIRFKRPTFWVIVIVTTFLGSIFFFLVSIISIKTITPLMAYDLFQFLRKINFLAYEAFLERLIPNFLWFLLIFLWTLISSIFGYWYAHFSQLNVTNKIDSSPRAPSNIRFWYIFLVVLFLFAEIRSLISFPNPIWGGDTDDYLYGAIKPLLDLKFYAWTRPWTTGLLYKILGANLEIIDYVGRDGIIRNNWNANAALLAQTMLHAISWIALALTSKSMIRSYHFRPVIVGIILAIGLSPAVVNWNHALLSESLSISLMVLLLAIWFWIQKGWNWHKAFILVGITVLWTFTRDSNALLVLALAVILVSIGLIIKHQRLYLFFSLFFVLLYFLSSYLSEIPNRWAVPLGNVIFQRVLPDQNALDFFMASGMPVDSAILDMEGRWICENSCAFFEEEKNEAFRVWLYENGRITYIRYLVSNYNNSLIAPLENLDILTEYSLMLPNSLVYKAPIPQWLSSTLFINGAVAFWVTLSLVFITLAFSELRTYPAVLVICAFFLLGYPHAFLSYHGDAMEVGRHSIQFSIQLRLCFWILALIFIDFFILSRGSKLRLI